MEAQFWLWLASWAVFIQRPSDLGYPDTGFDLPPMQVHWHKVEVDNRQAWQQTDSWGQRQLFMDQSQGLAQSAKGKRTSIHLRIDKANEIMAEHKDGRHWMIWHDLEAERHEIERHVPGVVTAYGSQDIDEREQLVQDFAQGRIEKFASKPSICGSGTNFQRHCADTIFLGVGYKFNDFIQSCHRFYRFQQKRTVNVHIVYLDSEGAIVQVLKDKWRRHDELMQKMSEILKKYQLTNPLAELTI